MEKLLTTEEVADHLRVDVVTIRRLVNRGELAAYRIGGEYRFIEPDIEDFVRRQRVSTGEKDNREAFKFFTERARKVMALAVNEAKQLEHNYVGTEHILLGLVGEGEGIAAHVLSSFELNVDRARDEIVAVLARGETRNLLLSKVKAAVFQGEAALQGRQIGLTKRARKVIELALDEAKRFEHHYIGTEHLLLGMLREGEGLAVMVLKNLNVDAQQVRAKAIEVLKAPKEVTQMPSIQVMPTEEDEATLINIEGESGTCSNCGLTNPVSNNFCPGCGKHLKTA